jgi:iron complex outermembrane receptor protein
MSLPWSAPRLVPFALFALAPIPILPAQSAAPSGPENTLVLSAFTVDARRDRGYVATNAIGATRTAVEIRNLPVSMQVFNEDFIRDQAATSLEDVVRYASNVVSSGTGAFNGDNTTFTIRGFETGYSLRNGFRRLSLVDTGNVERVEVIKGPASLLYGQIEPGGVINYITKKPVSYRTGSVKQAIGSYDLYRTELDYNQPLSKRAAFRFNGTYERSGAVEDFVDKTVVALAPSVRLELTPRTVLTLEFERTQRDIEGFRGLIPLTRRPGNYSFASAQYNLPRSFNLYNPENFSNLRYDVYGLEFTHEFNRTWQLRSAVTDSDRESTLLRTGSGLLAGPATTANPVTVNRGSLYEASGNEELFSQTDLVGTFQRGGVELKTLFGFEYRKDGFESANAGSIAARNPAPWDITNPATWSRSTPRYPTDYTLTGRATSKTEVTSYYTLQQLALRDGNLRALGGVRYDAFETKPYDEISRRAATPLEGDQVSPQLGVLYRPTPALTLYASYSESYRPYTQLKRNADGTQSVPLPQTGQGFDVGAKLDLLEGRVSGTVSWFQIERAAILRSVVNVIDPVSGLRADYDVQSGEERSQGIEADVIVTHSPGWQTLVSFSNTDAYVKSNVQNRTLEGLSLPNVPKNQAALWTKYRFSREGGKGFSLGAGLTYVGHRRALGDTTDPVFMGRYTVVDVLLGYETKLLGRATNFTLNVRNLTDEDFFKQRFDRSSPRHYLGAVRVAF